MALETFPYLKNCWLANVTLHYLYQASIELSSFLPLEILCTRPLNVHYRSAQQISEFCSKLVQFNRKGRFSSPRVLGTFLSEVQPSSVQVLKFSKESTVKNPTEKILFLDEFDPRSVMSEKYKASRWVMVICQKKEQPYWETMLLSKFEKDQLKIFCVEDGFPSCYCSGGEEKSVLLFIDDFLDDKCAISKDEYYDMFQVACSRAQFELVILISHKFPKVFENLSTCAHSSDNAAPKFIAMDDNVAIQYFLEVTESKIPDEKDIKTLVEHCNTTCNPGEISSLKFNDDILIVVLCEEDQHERWENFISSGEFNYHSKYIFSLDLYVESNLTAKFPTVFFFIDSPDKTIFSQNRTPMSNILTNVLSKATKQLLLYVRDDLKHISCFLTRSNSNENKIHIKNYHLASFLKISSLKSPGLYILFFYCKSPGQYDLTNKVEELIPFLKGPVNRPILLLLGVKQYSSIMKTLMRIPTSGEAQEHFTGSFSFLF